MRLFYMYLQHYQFMLAFVIILYNSAIRSYGLYVGATERSLIGYNERFDKTCNGNYVHFVCKLTN